MITFDGLSADFAASVRIGQPAPDLPRILHARKLQATMQRNELVINLADHHGTAKVALLDLAAQPIPGYELANCLPAPWPVNRCWCWCRCRPAHFMRSVCA